MKHMIVTPILIKTPQTANTSGKKDGIGGIEEFDIRITPNIK
jgi:hypothetical protein